MIGQGCSVHHPSSIITHYEAREVMCSGREQERLAKEAGFSTAVHYETGFGLMGVLVVTR